MKFVLIKEKIDGDNAVVDFKISSKKFAEDEKASFPLIKEEGKWKVTLPEL